ncbi:MAG: aminotransferase class V-fold PLP-dependent enzyme [Sandaracinaceae bacterium]|nr:aminotransferase class V-fold PLP-dependent enzyme [Sandaracinaceae bacterium]
MIYLDHAATGLPRLPAALAALADAAALGSPGRGHHRVAAGASAALAEARGAVAALAGGGTVCFTSGATAALNQAILGLRPAPRAVAVDPLLHNAARRPVHALGVPVWTLPHDARGRVDVAASAREWPAEIELVVVGHASNVTGALQPVAALAELARARGARTVVDCAQTAGLGGALDVGDAELIAFSSHKALRAPAGAGALVVRGGVALEPRAYGGTGADAADPEMPAELPGRLEAGTHALPAIAALGRAARHALAEPFDPAPLAAALQRAVDRSGARVLAAGELPIVLFAIDGVAPLEVEEILDRAFDLVVRAGLHCAPAAHAHLGTLAEGGAVRASAGAGTTTDDLAALTDVLTRLAARTR